MDFHFEAAQAEPTEGPSGFKDLRLEATDSTLVLLAGATEGVVLATRAG